MEVSAIYVHGKRVRRIYHGGVMIWPPTTELSLSVIHSIFSDGYHALLASDAIVLSPQEDMVTALAANLTMPHAVGLSGDMQSKTIFDGRLLPVDAVFCVCDLSSATQAEVNTLVADAISLATTEDIVTVEDIHAMIAKAVLCSHAEDQGTDIDAAALIAAAVCGVHREDMANTDEMAVLVAGAVYAAHQEDMDVEHEASADVAGAVSMPAIVEDMRTECDADMLTFRASDIVPLDVAEEYQTQEDAALEVPEAVELGALLHLVTTCEINMLVAKAASMSVIEANETAMDAVLSFDGEDEGEWRDPVQTGTDLYIRQTYEDPLQEGTNLEINEVFFPPEQDGSNLYIISLASVGGE